MNKKLNNYYVELNFSISEDDGIQTLLIPAYEFLKSYDDYQGHESNRKFSDYVENAISNSTFQFSRLVKIDDEYLDIDETYNKLTEVK